MLEDILDDLVKVNIARKSVLANIMKYTIDDYSSYDIQSIVNKFIEPNIKIGEQKVHYIVGSRNEDNTDKRRVTFDILFDAMLPNGEKVRINVEIQRKLNDKYHMCSRANYYNARMISTQYGAFFSKSNYDKLRKVISIWIILLPPKKKMNSLNHYTTVENNIFGKASENKKYFNKSDTYMVYLSSKESEYPLIELFKILFDGKMDIQLKKQLLKENYDIELDDIFEKEVVEMCNYSEAMKEIGMKAGLKIGHKEGKIEGKIEGINEGILITTTNILRNKMLKETQSLHDAMIELGIDLKDYPIYKKRIELN